MKKIIIILLTLITFNVNALEVEVKGNKMFLEGNIVEGDYYRVKEHLKHNMKVYLNSNGGLAYEGIAIGYLLNDHKVTTIIGENKECHSACGFLFLAGTKRVFDGILGIHCTSYRGTNKCIDEDHEVNKSLKTFLLNVTNEKTTKFYFDNAKQLKMKLFKK